MEEYNSLIATRLNGTNYEGSDTVLNMKEIKMSQSGERYEVKTPIANGAVILLRYTKRDDGATTENYLTLLPFANGKKLGIVDMPTTDLVENKFMQRMSVEYRPAVKGNSKAYIIDSIRAQAPNAEELTIYLNTGWRVIDGIPCFLHSGGAIGKDNVSVELDGRLSQYCFTENKCPERWNTFRRFLDVAPHSVTYPLLAISVLSPLNEFLRTAGCEPAFLLFLLGKTGSKKSTLAALTLCFFGAGFNNKSLPGSSKDTVNSLEKTGFLLKDVLTVIDDFYPSMNRNDSNRMESVLQGVARMYGDRTGRNRMYADGNLRPNYAVRGNALLTGEDIPAVGQSGEARFIGVELLAEDVKNDVLTSVQRDGEHLSECMREFIEWLIPKYKDLPSILGERFIQLREDAQDGGHGRISEAIAHLQTALELWFLFMRDKEIITDEQREQQNAESWSIFKTLAEKQNKVLAEEKPTNLFLSAMKDMLSIHKVRFAPMNRLNLYGNEIGWTDGNFVYLLPDVTYKTICQFYREQDKMFPLSKARLLKHLATENLIVADPGEHTKNKKIMGKTRRVIWLCGDALKDYLENSPESKCEKNIVNEKGEINLV